MQMNDMILVSVDDHVVEPPDMFKDHMPKHLFDKAPKVVSVREGDGWEYEGVRMPNFGLNAVVGRPQEEYGFEPASYSDIRKGTYDIQARVDDMNANGLLGSICFPTFPTFAGVWFLGAKDKELAKIVISAYNDWHVHGWCGAHQGASFRWLSCLSGISMHAWSKPSELRSWECGPSASQTILLPRAFRASTMRIGIPCGV